MGSMEVNIHTRSQQLINLTNALEQSVQNHRWSEVGSLLKQIIQLSFESVVQLSTVDSAVAESALNEIDKLVSETKDAIGENVFSEEPDAGEVASAPPERK